MGWFEQGAGRPSWVARLASQGSPTVVAFSADGELVAVATETRGRETPGKAWVIGPGGRVVWIGEFEGTVAGLHFPSDGSLVIVTARSKAVDVSLPAGTEKWHTP